MLGQKHFFNLKQSAVHMTSLELCLKLSQLCVHVCGIGDRIPHADASFHACERDA